MNTERWRVARRRAALLLLLAGPPLRAGPAVPDALTLDVPFLPQTEDLCGGASAAMLFRYWGDRHASAQQFEPLVDRRAGGIADTALVDAIRERHWSAERLPGSVDLIRSELAAGRPSMLLVEDRPQRFHYVVAVGFTGTALLVHDPTWGPARALPFEKLQQTWKPSGFWTLRVTPGTRATSPPPGPSTLPPGTRRVASECDARLDRALDDIERLGPDSAEAVLVPLMKSCPAAAGPWSELAGIRFSQHRWREAAGLAADALDRDPHDSYAADVLGSSRFMLNDFDGALRAWNRAGKPTLDSVRISGLSRTRYALIADALDLPVNGLLTAESFRIARRRLEALPDLSSARLSLRPDDERFAIAEAAVVERPALPKGPVQWVAAGAQAALEREATVNVPGRTGQGESWSILAGWWQHRPRVSIGFAAPLTSRPHGVWRVGMEWAVQTYGASLASELREEHAGGSLSLDSWIGPDTRLTATAGFDSWHTDGDTRRWPHVGATIEQRLVGDKVAASISASQYGAGAGFPIASAAIHMRTSRNPGPLVLVAQGGASHAGERAPFAFWSGAGEGRSRGPLLRAHRLLHDGRVAGPVFGRTLLYSTLEAQHWFPRPALLRLGTAAFVDAARAAGRPVFAGGLATQVDVGAGIRIRVPGRSGSFRLDYARGVRDGANAWFIGWNVE